MSKPEDSSRIPAAPDAGYEKRDAHANGIFYVVIGLFVGLVLVHYGLKWEERHLTARPATGDRWTAQRLASSGQIFSTNYPHLQIHPSVELAGLRAREEGELNSFGWVDRNAGIARVPIARAMDLVLQEGLPTRSGANGNGLGPSSYELQQQRPSGRQPEIEVPR